MKKYNMFEDLKMKEYPFEELGYFTKIQIENIKKVMDGQTFMNFKVSSSNMAGNHILIIKTDYEDSEENIKKFFLHCAIGSLK